MVSTVHVARGGVEEIAQCVLLAFYGITAIAGHSQ